MSKPVTTTEMIAEVRREIAMRDRAYPVWVKNGKLSLDVAQRRIDVMEAVARLLEGFEGKETFSDEDEDDES